MINGTITLEDITIQFYQKEDSTIVNWTITCGEQVEVKQAEGLLFFAALSIAVHNDAMPDYRADYPLAESIQGKIRWIP